MSGNEIRFDIVCESIWTLGSKKYVATTNQIGKLSKIFTSLSSEISIIASKAHVIEYSVEQG